MFFFFKFALCTYIPPLLRYNLAIGSCEQAHQGRRALGLLQEMRRMGITPEASTYNTVISAMLEMADSLKPTLNLWIEMIRYHTRASVCDFKYFLAVVVTGLVS